MDTMKAIRIHHYGGPEVLRFEDAPCPVPGFEEVLIRVHAAGVNPVDWKIRAGYLKEQRPYTFPLILGWDLSGVVEAVGPGATKFKVGDEVYSRPDIARNGAYAEYIAVKEAEVAFKPISFNHIQAGAVPLACLTAWQAIIDVARLNADQKILIHGAAGGVGGFAVQLAKWRGAYVIGTASGGNQPYLRELGVDEPIDYEKTRFEDLVRGVEVVFDTVGGDTQRRSWKVLRKGGILVSIVAPPSSDEAAKRGVRQAFVFVTPNGRELAEIAELADSGKLKPVDETIMPLSEAREAHELSQTGHTHGKIVLCVV